MTNHTHSKSSRQEIIRPKNNDKLLELYQRINSDFMPKKSNQCNFVLQIIQIQKLLKNNQVKTVDKLLQLIQRTNSDFKSNKSN